MTCAACATRIERRLNRLEGVEATVSLATDQAHVRFDPTRVTTADLVEAVHGAGYTATLGPPEEEERDRTLPRLVVAVALALPVIAISMIPALQFDRWGWVALVLATPVVAWCGWPFHAAAVRNLRHASLTMDTLISMGSLAAWGWSLVALIWLGAGAPEMRMSPSLTARHDGGGEIYLEVACGVIALLLVGRWLEGRGRRRAGAAVRALARAGVREATVLRDGREEVVPADRIGVGEQVIVRPGARIPVDGVVADGSSAIDRSIVTGESLPVDVAPGDEVAGGTVNAGGGRLIVQATRVGADTTLAQIGRLVASAQAGRAPVQRLVDRVSAVFVPVVIAIALATLCGWLVSGADATTAFGAAVSVLVIACPCALGLATPAALAAGIGRGAQLGILIGGPRVLESSRRVSTVLLDKTGTLTRGTPHVSAVATAAGASRDDVLGRAAAVEAGSAHPLARAIVTAHTGPLPAADDFREQPGAGASATIAGATVTVGRAGAGPLAAEAERLQAGGTTVVEVRSDGDQIGLIALRDELRPEAPAAVAALAALGVRPVLLTGDAPAPARRVAAELGIDDVIDSATPEGKLGEVRRRQAAGQVVAMAGDGVNDAPALAAADLGIAVGTGAEVAAAAADITLVHGDPRGIADAIRLARSTLRTIQWNLAWAFGYNVAAIPVAVAGLLSPLLAAAAMAASSVLVVANSVRLLGFRSSAAR